MLAQTCRGRRPRRPIFLIKFHSFSGGETPPLRFKRIFYSRGGVLPPAGIEFNKYDISAHNVR